MKKCDRGELMYLAQPDNRNLNVLYNTLYLPATVGGRWRGWGGPGGGGGGGGRRGGWGGGEVYGRLDFRVWLDGVQAVIDRINNQHTGELISARKTSYKHRNKDLNRYSHLACE